jgi:hypothetical protein
VGPVPDPLLLRKSGNAGDRTRTSLSVARNSAHQTTEAVASVQMSQQNLKQGDEKENYKKICLFQFEDWFTGTRLRGQQRRLLVQNSLRPHQVKSYSTQNPLYAQKNTIFTAIFRYQTLTRVLPAFQTTPRERRKG